MSGQAGTPGGQAGTPGEPYRLLFVCTGNTCRSPLAEVLARQEAESRGWTTVEAKSAGIFAAAGEPASDGARTVAGRRGIDLADHRASVLSPDLIAWADLVIGMSESHLRVARDLGAGEKAALLTGFLPEEHPTHLGPVVDPVGGSTAAYEETCQVIEEAMVALFDRLSQIVTP